MEHPDAPLPEIKLTPDEEKLFVFLRRVLKHFNLKTTLRVAGGWVRDKLRGLDCSDIDITLDDMYGKQFAEYVNEVLKLEGQEVHHIGVIKVNPEQSKHLETAKMRVYHTWVDFVNLRAEEYAENSRIPTMRIGTPLEDALRRDLTINSMFYNINESRVEDFTKKGLGDLREGRIRTPLPPLTTFLDDPLRVLRTVRFASRYRFKVDEDTVAAAMNASVQDALRKKISRERIGDEFSGMLNGKDPSYALGLITQWHLFDIVFATPPGATHLLPNLPQLACVKSANVTRFLRHNTTFAVSPDERYLLYLCATLDGLKTSVYPAHKGRTLPSAGWVIRESLRYKTREASDTDMVLNIAPQLHKLAHSFPFSRKDVGVTLRKIGPIWRVAYALAATYDLAADIRDSTDHLTAEEVGRLQVFEALHKQIESHQLIGVWNLKPLVTGDDLTKLTGIQPGLQFKHLLELEIDHQLEFPTISLPEMEAWLQTVAKTLPT